LNDIRVVVVWVYVWGCDCSQGGGFVVSFVGCFSGIFSNGEDESDIACEELVCDGSFARDFWN
jgi:hypothetical protein